MEKEWTSMITEVGDKLQAYEKGDNVAESESID